RRGPGGRGLPGRAPRARLRALPDGGPGGARDRRGGRRDRRGRRPRDGVARDRNDRGARGPRAAVADPGDRAAAALHVLSGGAAGGEPGPDRKSTRLNSSHLVISYAVFCLKKKKKKLIY